MRCPFCSESDTRVINSRPAASGDIIRRRRECPTCEGRFTTFEQLEKTEQTVIKRDGKRMAYSRDRLFHGLEKACKKRPVTAQQIEDLVSAIEKEAFRTPAGEVTSEVLGKLVLQRLRELDVVAYLRFASVYKQFTCLEDFEAEIRALRG